MTVSIDIPDEAGVDEHFLKEALAASLYYTGKLSQKQARNVLGMTRRAFEEMLPRYGYSILVDSESNLDIERGA
jgi:predicted HTH domain antitoxin